MTARVSIAALPGCVLREADGLLRDHVRAEARRSAHYLERFDRTTLFYDCVWRPDGAGRVITAPRFLNLWPVLRDGLAAGGQAQRIARRRIWLRCEQLDLPGTEPDLTLDLPGGPRDLPTRRSLAEAFRGLDCLVAVNKDNALAWVHDWARYHARRHGTRGVVIFDNGSTAYDANALAAALAAVPALEAVAVLRAPFPYGPNDQAGRFEVSPRFFQSAMLNIARRDALAQARSVLSIDIDEIVRSASGRSVHDLAVARPGGMVTIQGRWIYPAPGTDSPRPQRDHLWRADPDRKCNRKWCLRPGGLMDRFGWAVHQIGGLLQNLLTEQHDCGLLHCRATSTGWKSKRFRLPKSLRRDAELEAFMGAEFPAPESAPAPSD